MLVGPEAVESVPHTNPQTPNRSFLTPYLRPISFCSASILQIVFPPKMNLGKVQWYCIYVVPPMVSICGHISWVLTHRVVLASGRSRRGIKSPAVFSSIKCLGPAKEAHVNRFHSKPHSILPHAQRGSLTLTVEFSKASFYVLGKCS